MAKVDYLVSKKIKILQLNNTKGEAMRWRIINWDSMVIYKLI